MMKKWRGRVFAQSMSCAKSKGAQSDNNFAGLKKARGLQSGFRSSTKNAGSEVQSWSGEGVRL
jgi:hypothetical protein